MKRVILSNPLKLPSRNLIALHTFEAGSKPAFFWLKARQRFKVAEQEIAKEMANHLEHMHYDVIGYANEYSQRIGKEVIKLTGDKKLIALTDLPKADIKNRILVLVADSDSDIATAYSKALAAMPLKVIVLAYIGGAPGV